MLLLDRYLPEFSFKETHWHDIPASQTDVMAQAMKFRPEQDAFIRHMIALREIPMRLRGRLDTNKPANANPFGLDNFTLLEQSGDAEVAFGLIGKFWRLNYGQVRCEDTSAFQTFDTPGMAKLVLGFSTRPLGGGLTRLSTETRVYCTDRAAWAKFAPYWYLIRPVSGLIRKRILRSIGANTMSGAKAST